jgi:hypothetical protein
MRNIQEQTPNKEMKMLGFVKDLLAMVALCGFSVTALTWMDVATRLV